MVHRSLTFLSQIVLLFSSSVAIAAGPLFDSDEVLELTLTGPLGETIVDTRHREERNFVLEVDGESLDVAVRVRGKSRVEICRFPPLRLDFSESDPAGTVFEGQGALKLVTHCWNNDDYEQNVLEEYAAFKAFALFTDVSFGARLMRIRYVDTNEPDKVVERHALVLESSGELAARVNGTLVHTEFIQTRLLDLPQTARVFVFQFMIGNTDWSLVKATGEDVCCHNGILLEVDGAYHYVPYDFDLAGIVNARYAEAHPNLKSRHVRTRRYRGNCIEGLATDDAIQLAVDLEPEILAIIRGLPKATKKLTRSRIKYMSDFFEAARDSDSLARRFEKRCVD